MRTICHQWNAFSSRSSGLLLDGFSTCIEFQWHLSFFTREDFYSPVCLTFGGVEIICHYIIACLNCRNVDTCCHTFGGCTDLSSSIVRWRYVPCSSKVTFGHLELPTRILLWLLVNWFLVTSIRHTFFFKCINVQTSFFPRSISDRGQWLIMSVMFTINSDRNLFYHPLRIMQMYSVSSLQCLPSSFNLSLRDAATCIQQRHF